jgi:Na+/H+-translocating membrane pyrophosphatase
VKFLVYFIGVSMALEQLGIGRDTVLVSFGIIFSGLVLALSIAFGLGGKDVAREYLEKKLKEKRQEEDDFQHL